MAINFMDPTAALERSFGLTKSGMPYSVARKLARYGIGQDDSDVPYMNPEQERSMMAELGQMGAHAIGTVGALLDVPGAMIRNALVGKPVTEPLVSPLSAAGRATGRDVLAKFGIMGETPAELPWYSGERIGRAAAGLGAEVVLDPLTWMTFGAGAATKAGRAMQSLGKQALRETAKLKGMGWRELWTTTKINPIDELLKLSPNAKKYEAMLEDFAIKNNTTLDALRGERLGTTLGLHIPFTHATMPIPSPLDYLAKGMDKRMSTLGTSMLGRHFQAAWNPEMMGTTSETVQPYAQKIFNDTLDLTAESRSKVFPMLETAAKAGWLDPSHIRTVLRSSGAPDHSMDTARRIADELGADLVHYAETKHIPGAAQIDLTKYPHLSQADLPVIKQVMDQFQGVTKAEFDLERQFGVNMETINENLLGYTHRRVNPMPDPGFKYPGHKAIDAQAAHQMERAKFMEYVPTKLLNELSIDDAISGQAWKYTSLPADFYKTAALDLETRYGARYAAELAHLKAANKDVNWQSLARWASNLNPLYAEKGIYRYATDPFEVLTRRVEASAQVRAAARGVFDILNDHAGMMVRGKPGEKAASVREVLGQTPGLQWLTDAQGVKHRDSLQAWLGDFFSKTNRANIQGRQALHDQLESSLGPLVKNGVTDEEAIAKWGAALVIPQSVGKDINRLMSTFTLPESLGPLMDVYDKVLNRWKRWVTVPWPAFHTRNFWSGMVRNAVAGNFNPIDYANATNVLQRGKLLPGAGKRYFEGKVISDEAASEAIRQELFSQRIVTHHGGMQDLNEIVPIGGTPLDIPGITKGWQPVRRIDPTKWNKATDPWLTGGAAGSYWVEGENRIAAYLNMRAKGMSPTAAADRVRQLQVDYSPQFTTQADRVMKRLIPFWCVPTDHEILTSSGWKTYDQLSPNELVLTMNMDSRVLEWQPLAGVAHFDFSGELLRIQKRSPRKSVDDGVVIEFLCTEHHRWPVEYRDRSTGRSEDSPWNRKIVMAYQFLGKDDYRLMTTGDYQERDSILSPRLAAILGWVVTDGYFRYRGNHCEMMVYQSPKNCLSDVISLLGTKARKPHPETGVVCVPVSLEDVSEIRKVFSSKSDLPSIVCGLSREAADAMWDAMFNAEGNYDEDGNPIHFTQTLETNMPVLEAFQILCIMTGRAANLSPAHDPKGCYVRKRTHYRVQNGIDRVKYNGVVWCPTTPNGTWVMRHKGAVVITGNSFHKGILPWTVKTLLERPGGTLSQLAKRTATLRADTPLLPESVQRTTAIGLPPDEPGGMKFLSTLGFMEEPMYGAMAPLVQLPFSFAQGLGAPIRAGATPMQAMGEFAREIISQTNPLAKLVPELAFQRSSYFGGGESGGRELRTLTPPMGQLASRISTAFGRDMPVTPFGMPFATESIGRPAELLAGLTPVARLTSLLNTAFDPRKSWLDRATNIFTGLKTTDVSANQVAAQRNEALRNAMIAYGAKTFVKPYFKTEDLARMKGPERAQADALNNMARWLDYKYRQEKKAMGRS